MMEIVIDIRKARYEREMEYLRSVVPTGCYKIFRPPFPNEIETVPGRYSNNLIVVLRYQLNQSVNCFGFDLTGTVIEYRYIRDDREQAPDESTKHVNVHYRLVAQTHDGNLAQESYTDEDHHSGPVDSTAMPVIYRYARLDGLSDSGHISDLNNRGFGFRFMNSIGRLL
jgi:hypothetical protein